MNVVDSSGWVEYFIDGENADRSHGEATPDVREAPLFFIENQKGMGIIPDPVSMLQIAPTICLLLGLPIPSTMKMPPILNA